MRLFRERVLALALAPAGVTPRDVTDVPVTEAILELVRAGVVVSAMASWVAQPDLEQGRLRAVRIGRRGLHRTWWAVTSARRPTPATVSAFLEILRRTCITRSPRGAPRGPGSRATGTVRRRPAARD
jgi:LysR family transcriptional regulator for metE and metH